MTTNQFITNIRNLIANDEMDAALGQLQLLLDNSPQLDEAIIQAARFQDIRKQIRLGLVSHAEANLTKNQIRFGLMDLLSEIETQGAKPALHGEIERAISIVGSKNVVAGSTISAGGNVHIGDVHITHTTTPAPLAALNEYLTRRLIEAISRDCNAAARFLERANAANPRWETDNRIGDKAKEILAYSFVGVIGVQLSKLMAIGKEPFSEITQRKHLEKCLHIAKRCLDLAVFSLVSRLWDEKKKQTLTFTEAQQKALTDFFDRPFEPAIGEQYQLLETLYGLFVAQQLPFPLPELQSFWSHLEPGSAFQNACNQLQTLGERLGKVSISPEDSLLAEHALADFLGAFHFLVNYRMASIKRIGYTQIRNGDPHYLHRYAALGIDSKANIDAEKINFTPETVCTDSVLLYQGERYQENINLSPFVIDYNALTAENGAKICFFRAKALADDSLEYCFLEDNSAINIASRKLLKNNTDLNELLMNPENRKILNLDNVVNQYGEARKALLGDSFNFDDF